MELFNVVALLIALTAFFAYLNHWTLRLPTTIGVMGLALFFSLVLIALGRLGLVGEAWTAWFREVDFGPTLLQGMLGFLLFAGALHVDLGDLLDQKWVVTLPGDGRRPALDRRHRCDRLPGLRCAGPRTPLALLPSLRRIDLAHGSHRGALDPQARRHPAESGDEDRRGVALQRRGRRRRLPGDSRGRPPADPK